MAVKSPRLVVQQVPENDSFVRRHWLLIILVLLAFVTYLLGRFSNLDILMAFKGSQQSLASKNSQLEEENARLQEVASIAQTELLVRTEAIRQMQQAYASLLEENSRLQSDVDFYRKLLSTDDGSKTLRTFSVSATPLDGNLVNLRLILAQKLEKAYQIKGAIGLQLKGISAQTSQSVDLIERFNLGNDFDFKYYQVLNYTISLADGFNPTELTVKLTENKRGGTSVEQTFQWSEITQVDTQHVQQETNQ